ncbi:MULTISPECIES: metallophosphoesterase family protein [unclassified Chitinophaga]|uniref:metallophosphoesterase family protein n=1 Tax=unclassified Chitinophaga TaxID=2619133 RepID=UPI00300FE8AA
MAEKLTIAIASDLHCRYGDGKEGADVNTWLTSDLMEVPVERNPVAALKRTILKESLVADLLICPGDITDKTDKQGLISGWRYLEDIKSALSASELVATVGNHDVDSRKKLSEDPTNYLKRFSLKFPTSYEIQNTMFWSEHFCILELDLYDLLVINSSFNHIDEKSCYKSLIQASTLEKIEGLIEPIKNNGKVKICITHHHPIKHSNVDYEDGDSIERGDELIELLIKNNFTIHIHGHKHDPRLTLINDFPVFASGSFSSLMNLTDLTAQNVFHLIEIEYATKKGKIRSWIYSRKEGWHQRMDTYFPCNTGFGAKITIDEIADLCLAVVNKGADTVAFSEVVNQIPEIIYLTPTQQRKLTDLLAARQVNFLPALPNIPKLISKLYT